MPPMDKSKLRAFMDREGVGKKAPPSDVGGAPPGLPGAGAEEEDPGAVDIQRFYPVMEWLEEAGETLESATEAMDEASLLDEEAQLSPADAAALDQLIPALPVALVDGLTELAPTVKYREAMALAQHMGAEGWVTDSDTVGGLLWQLCQKLAGGAAKPAAPGAPPGAKAPPPRPPMPGRAGPPGGAPPPALG